LKSKNARERGKEKTRKYLGKLLEKTIWGNSQNIQNI